MSQGPLCPNLSQKVQKEVSKMANRNLSPVILLGGLSVNLNHLKNCENVCYLYRSLESPRSVSQNTRAVMLSIICFCKYRCLFPNQI